MWVANFFFSWFFDMLIVKKYVTVTWSRKIANTVGKYCFLNDKTNVKDLRQMHFLKLSDYETFISINEEANDISDKKERKSYKKMTGIQPLTHQTQQYDFSTFHQYSMEVW